jgi:hypothetical protein
MSSNFRLIPLVLLVLPLATASAQEVYQLRTEEDPQVVVSSSFCSQAPFSHNLTLGASVYAPRTRGAEGKVVNEGNQRVGQALACVRLTDLSFNPGGLHDFYIRFDLPEGSFTATGKCMVNAKNVPSGGLVLAGCTLKLVGGPEGTRGGQATSASIFNPLRLPGINTGSYWTLVVYR